MSSDAEEEEEQGVEEEEEEAKTRDKLDDLASK